MPISYNDEDKGAPIRVIGGKYAGRKGWKHSKPETETQIYVILMAVIRSDGTLVHQEKAVRISKDHVTLFERARTVEERILEQKPLLSKKMMEFLKELVKLDIAPNEDMIALVGQHWLRLWRVKRERLDFTERSDSPPPANIIPRDDQDMNNG
jgi:hypothetical protein